MQEIIISIMRVTNNSREDKVLEAAIITRDTREVMKDSTISNNMMIKAKLKNTRAFLIQIKMTFSTQVKKQKNRVLRLLSLPWKKAKSLNSNLQKKLTLLKNRPNLSTKGKSSFMY